MTIHELHSKLAGKLYTDTLHKHIYATDASIYQQLPIAVAIPDNKDDVKQIVKYAKANSLSIIPRAAGTSLAGQCVGKGIVVDLGKNFQEIRSINTKNKSVILQPGVIRDELNMVLKKHNMFFAPNTSTSNRCMIGGMVGNNSSGTTSIQYGVTRDKVIAVKCILADAKEVEFREYSIQESRQKAKLKSIEGKVYQFVLDFLENPIYQKEVIRNYPKISIHRRNTGYALDDLLKQYRNKNSINVARLLCGSEGTLGITTEIELSLDPLPPKHAAMLVAHFKEIKDCMQAVSTVMQHQLFACEMMDDTILDCTKDHLKYRDYRFFIHHNPKAILLLELKSDDKVQLEQQISKLQKDLRDKTNSYTNPVLYAEDIQKAFTLRKAGLGLLGSIAGDQKAVGCIEDTAVALEDLPAYIKDFSNLMQQYKQSPIYYAHAGAGELHLRPVLNLKEQKGVEDLKCITKDVASIVKKYRGSLSGEHGDGIVRSGLIKYMVGDTCYQLLCDIKDCFDPYQIFNPGKITNPLPIDDNLRYKVDRPIREQKSFLDFSPEIDLLHAAENCNGSGDCRKTQNSIGTMCPSYHATKNEKDTTRARANALRHYLTNPEEFKQKELMSVFDLCISCKACKKECPSAVDASCFKAEITYQYYQKHYRPIRDYLIGYHDTINRISQPFYWLYNTLLTSKYVSKALKSIINVHQKRSIPTLSKTTFKKQFYDLHLQSIHKPKMTVYLFVDEFTNRLESNIGLDACRLLHALGYQVKILPNLQSGRALLSKGFLKKAKEVAEYNINLFRDKISKNTPLIGIEPSAILAFRDDYLRLTDDIKTANKLSDHVFLIEEFISQEIQRGNITSSSFSTEKCKVKIHVHCHQKALSNSKYTFDSIHILENAEVSIIPSGCCGMAGGFGYEKEHYEISVQIGNTNLLTAVKRADKDTYILSNGSSCRHQIKDITSKQALHPVSFLYSMLSVNRF